VDVDDSKVRQRAARVLSLASVSDLASRWARWAVRPTVEYIRGPEAGLVMIQGRIGGAGDRFNLGEATVTRATVVLRGGALQTESVGTSYVLGSETEHAGLAAIFDALLADPGQRKIVIENVIEPLERQQNDRDAATRNEARSTVVDFLTIARENAAGSVERAED
jgi:alpha-D-ribose 1-methylphosphonate 5-triphosphate synthase subunit PhnG